MTTAAAVAGGGTPNEDKWLKLAREAASSSCSYFDTNIRAQIEADIRQFNGVHPRGSKYLHEAYRSRSRFFRPKTRAAIRKNEAVASEAYFSNKDILSIEGARDQSDPRQKASADFMKAVMQHRLTKSIPWFLILNGAYQDAQVAGICISHPHWEYNPKKKIDRPVVDLVPVENFRFDANAKWYDPVGSSPYLIHMIPMYVKDVRARMQPDPDTGKARWATLSEADLLAGTKPYAGSDTVRQEREQGRTDPSATPNAITDYTIVWVHRNIVEDDGEDYVFYTLGTHRRLSEPRKLVEEYWHGRRPYVVGQCMIETHKVYPGGVARVSRDTQGEINEIANQRIDNVRFAMNKRYFAKRNAQVDIRSLTRNAVSSVTLMNDPEKDVKIVETNDVTGSSYQEQDRLNVDFDDLVGSFSSSSVQSNRQLNETVGGMNLLTRNLNQVNGYQLKTFNETWVEPTLNQVMLLEQHYEDDEMLIALAGKQAGLVERHGINEVDDALIMQELSLNVNVGMGATNPQDKVNNLMLGIRALREVLDGGLIERLGGDVREIIKEILGAVGFHNGERFFPDMEEQDPAIRQLMEQVQQLQQALEAKHPPELLAAQVQKLVAEAEKSLAQKVEIGVKAAFSAMQAGQVIAATPQVAPIADEVMKGAGYKPQPGGVDPNFPGAGMAPGPITQNAIKDPRTGIEYTPGGTVAPPNPATPGTGAEAGIETLTADSV
jgi:hypothetical protein